MRSLKLLSMSVAAVLALTATVAFAQRDAGAKMRGEFGTGFHNSGRSATVYSYRAAPVVVWTPAPAVPAAPQVAQAPTARRAFSVEPNAAATATAPCEVPHTAVVPQRSTVRRSYSYEPTPAYSYGVPAYRRGGVQTPSYMLPKTDPRKYGGY